MISRRGSSGWIIKATASVKQPGQMEKASICLDTGPASSEGDKNTFCQQEPPVKNRTSGEV
ncbi:hypothetical protein TWF730_000209 [Orbilia blumenaviensis]|uniref:Uncharacterized protein n=1 Tax=Orbilia blumenaviensis TaxID=1796055 RepID=A0AAV9VKU7_9PEZI